MSMHRVASLLKDYQSVFSINGQLSKISQLLIRNDIAKHHALE